MSTEQNKALAHQLLEEVFNQGNMSRFNELVAPDFVEHEEMPPGVPRNREGVAMLLTMLRSAFPDFKATIGDVIAEGDKVVVRMTWTGTQQGEFMGMPSSGKPMSIGVIDIFRMEEGKLVEHWGLSDTMSMMEQLGGMPVPE
jgi:steroid delta-isomerase-like uncharacterized protein